jgi:hypothetical protein
MQRAKQQQAQEKMNALREEQMRMQMDAQRRAAEQEERDNTLMRQPFTQMPGPTQDQGPLMPRFDARHLLGQGMSPAGAMQALNLHTAMNPKPKRQFEKVEGTLLEIPEQGAPQSVFQAPPKEPEQSPLARLLAEREKFPPGHPMRQIYDQRIKKESTHQPATVVNTGDNAFLKEFASDAAKALGASRDTAKASVTTLQALDRMDKALDAGALSGPTSRFQSYGLRLGQIAGVGGKDAAETLAKTRELLQGAAQLNVDSAKALAGQGAVSNFEREMLEKAAGGGVEDMSQPEIKAVIRVLKKANRQRIKQHGDSLKNVDPKFSPFIPFYEVPMPAEDEPAAPTAPVATPGLPTRDAIEAELRRRGGR